MPIFQIISIKQYKSTWLDSFFPHHKKECEHLSCLLNYTFNICSFARHRLRWKLKLCVSKCIKMSYFALIYKNMLNRNDRPDLLREKIQLYDVNLWQRSTHSFKFSYTLKRCNVAIVREQNYFIWGLQLLHWEDTKNWNTVAHWNTFLKQQCFFSVLF